MAFIVRVTTILAGPQVVGGGVNQMYFGPSVGTAAQLVTAVRGFWFALAATVATGNTFEVQSEAAHIDEETGELLGVVTGTGGTESGSGGTTVLPPANQGMITWLTPGTVDSRRVKGRTFIPGMITANATGGIPTAGLKTVFTTASGNLIADANSELVVWSRPRKARPQVGAPGDAWYLPAQAQRAGSSHVVTSALQASKFAVLRGRRDA